MSEPIVPIIRLPVDPAGVQNLKDGSYAAGGVRVKTTIYVVEEADMPGGRQTVTTLVAPTHATVEFKVRPT